MAHHRGAVGDVELKDARAATHRLDLGLDRFGLVATRAAVQHDVMASLGQTQRDGATDAA